MENECDLCFATGINFVLTAVLLVIKIMGNHEKMNLFIIQCIIEFQDLTVNIIFYQ